MALHGYKYGASFSRDKKKHGGVAIFSRTELQCKCLQYVKHFSGVGVFECYGVQVECTDLIVVAIYRPPTNCDNDTKVFLDSFEKMCKYLSQSTKQVVIGGDYNIDFNNDSSNLTSDFINILNSYNMKISTAEPTRVTYSSSKCIDSLVINSYTILLDVKVLNSNLSDHFAVLLTLALCNRSIGSESRYRGLFSERNIRNFCDMLSTADWASVLRVYDCDLSFNCVFGYRHFENCFPVQKVSTRTNSKKCKPWLTSTPEILELKSKLDIFADLSRQYPVFSQIQNNILLLCRIRKRKKTID